MNNLEFFFYLFVYGAILTYLILGFIISFESMLALYGVKSAIRWIREWHSPQTYKTMLIIFLPMLQLAYLFLEIIPHLIGLNKQIKSFDLDRIYISVFPKECS
ncbi:MULTISPECIES: hypothetical protein [unclassified Nitratiruptor]|uniref:hypothetical protein n=1 Tax=unclassified Nitratiruptor TaxID=2624044 RepID=UPI001916281D|nr:MULTISPECIES: hypothetical protein [unclassified Nitratiruptor]BCD59552.1 hypothetical protein NitYY0810_C0302 [Nitratiruptor sp. YY08-10]BCD63476.1 hypothetical protein NitYY0814_C0302 [Nitratiruptor sp. YY08-14]